MSIFLLKLIAVFFMVVDHIKYAFPNCFNAFTLYFGRIAFPIFAFCTVEGYFHTKNYEKYVKRLLIAGVIAEIPFLLFNTLPLLQNIGLNIMFTLALGLVALKSYEFLGGKFKGLISVLVIAIIAEISKVDYGFFGIFLMFSLFIFRDSKLKTLLLSSAVVSTKYLYRMFILGTGFTEYPVKCWICTALPLFIILLYNGKKGPSLKWFFYIFYPVHYLILYMLSPYTSFI